MKKSMIPHTTVPEKTICKQTRKRSAMNCFRVSLFPVVFVFTRPPTKTVLFYCIRMHCGLRNPELPRRKAHGRFVLHDILAELSALSSTLCFIKHPLAYVLRNTYPGVCAFMYPAAILKNHDAGIYKQRPILPITLPLLCAKIPEPEGNPIS